MFEPLLVLKQSGPKVIQGTACVYRDGLTMRLSKDLLQKAEPLELKREVFRNRWTLYPFIDVKEKILKLELKNDGTAVSEMMGWFSHRKNARSLLVNIRPIMEMMGFSVGETPGVYEAKAFVGTIEIYFGKRIK